MSRSGIIVLKFVILVTLDDEPIRHVVAFELPPWLIVPSMVSTLFGDIVIVLVFVTTDALPGICDGDIAFNSFDGF